MNNVEKAYKYRIYPNKQQQILIQKTFGCCRFVYNQYLAKRIELYKQNKSTMNYNQCSKNLKDLKQEFIGNARTPVTLVMGWIAYICRWIFQINADKYLTFTSTVGTTGIYAYGHYVGLQ